MVKWISSVLAGLLLLSAELSAQPVFTITPSTEENVNAGDQFSVDIVVSNFTDIISLQYALTWDASVIAFESISDINIAGLSTTNFGIPGSGTVPSDRITLTWFQDALTGVSLANGTVIYTLNFTAVNGGTTTIDFSMDPPGVEILDVNLDDVGIDPVPASITVTGTGTGGGDTGGGGDTSGVDPVLTDGFAMVVGNQTAAVGETFCVPITVQDFNSILGMQMSITYNADVLSYNNVGSFGLTGLDGNAFGNPAPGTITLSWFDNALAGVTLPDNTVLFELCFTGSANGVSGIGFSNSPTIIEISNAVGDILDFQSSEGVVTVGTGIGESVGFTLTAESGTTEVGETQCFGITASGFEEVLGMQFSMNYNSTLFDYSSVGNFGLSGLTESFFGVPGGGTTPGNITLSWYDESLAGISLANGTELFEVCLTAKTSGSGTLSFSGTPTIVEVSNSIGEIIDFNTNPGAITITGESSGGGGSENPSFTGFGLLAGDTSGMMGDEVCVPVTTQSFEEILGMQFSMNYNADVLEFSQLKNFGLSGLTESLFGVPGGGTTAGNITLSWFDNNLVGITLPDDSKLFDVCFNALSNSTSSFSFSGTPTSIEISDAAGTIVPFNSASSTISISEDGGGDTGGGDTGGGDTGGGGEPLDTIGDGFGLLISDANVMQGDEFCLSITTQLFDEILGMQFSMNYNATLLEFDRVDNLNLSGLTESLFGTPAGGGTPGNITLSWFDNNLTGITLEDGTQIFDVCFTAIADGTSDVVFSDTPTFVEISDAAGEIVPFDSKSGRVVVGDEVVNPTDPDDILIAVSSESTLLDSTFCVDLTVQNYDAITALDFDVLFDPAVLSYESGANFGLDNFSETNLTESGGTIGVVWSGTAQTLGSNANLLSLCFVANDLGTTTVSVDTVMGNYTIQNDASMAVGLQSTNGTVVVSPNVISSDFLLEISDREVTQGGSVCLPVNAFNFTDIIGMQLSIGYDTAALTLDEVSSFGLSGLSAGSFGTVLPGIITLSWTDDQLSGQTLSDGSTLFELCFTSKGTDGSSTVVDFMNAPTAIEIINTSEELVVFTGSSGTVTVAGSTPFVITDTLITRPCTDSETGSIALTVGGGTPPYSFEWNTGATTAELNDITLGTYNVTITDAIGSELLGTFDLTANPAIDISAIIINASGAMTNENGSIDLVISGGSSPYLINWENGATTADLDGLAAGEYCVTITDAVGCSVDTCFTVGLDMLDLEFEITEEPVSCHGATDGSIGIAIRGGATPYDVVFDDGIEFTSTNGMVIRGDLAPGTYNFTVTDAMDSSLSGTAVVGEADSLVITEAIVISTMDVTNCSGQINLTVSGGTAPYTMLWDHGVMGVDLNRLCEGTYGGTLTDINGCSIPVGPFEIDLFSVTETITDVVCPSDQDGSIELSIIGGMEPFTFSWTEAGGREISSAQNLTEVGVGVYGLAITDGLDRTTNFTYTITSTSDLSGSIVAETDFNGFDISCSDSNDGRLVATGLQGGGTYTYEWFSNDESQGTTAALSDVGVGVYEAVVTDNIGCTATISYEVNPPDPIAITAQIKDAECFGSSDGAIEADATGGVPAFRYRWSTSDIGFGLYEVAAGNYTVTVTDANDCQTTMDFAVGEASSMIVEVSATAATDGCNGTASAAVTGGTGPYNYIWAGALGQNAADLVDLCPGEYQVFVTDSRGCQPEDDGNTVVQVLDRRFPCEESSTVITPNGDGFNDIFIINCVDELNDNLLQIFNSWGQLVYQAQNYDNSWAGTNIDGVPLAEGAYYYVLEYPDTDGNTIQLTGSFNILLD